MTIELPEPLAAELAALVPEAERDRFAVAAVADAVLVRQRASEGSAGPAAERDAAECVRAVEEALVEMDAGRGLISFEDVTQLWEADKAARRAGRP